MILNGTTLAIGQRPAFRKDIDIVSSTFDRFPHDLLCLSPSVERCSIYLVHSLVPGGLYGFNGRFLVLASPLNPLCRLLVIWCGCYSVFTSLEIALAMP